MAVREVVGTAVGALVGIRVAVGDGVAGASVGGTTARVVGLGVAGLSAIATGRGMSGRLATMPTASTTATPILTRTRDNDRRGGSAEREPGLADDGAERDRFPVGKRGDLGVLGSQGFELFVGQLVRSPALVRSEEVPTGPPLLIGRGRLRAEAPHVRRHPHEPAQEDLFGARRAGRPEHPRVPEAPTDEGPVIAPRSGTSGATGRTRCHPRQRSVSLVTNPAPPRRSRTWGV
jgi:hypothetical protein